MDVRTIYIVPDKRKQTLSYKQLCTKLFEAANHSCRICGKSRLDSIEWDKRLDAWRVGMSFSRDYAWREYWHLVEKPPASYFEVHLEIDHIKPLLKGGKFHDEKNMQVLCRECHLEKTKMDKKKDTVFFDKGGPFTIEYVNFTLH